MTAAATEPTPFAGYLAFVFSGADHFTVGLLVLDRDGFPLDFRFSSPVQPSAMQKALYGQSLEPWLLQSVCRELFRGLQEKPRILLTNYKELDPDWLEVPLYLMERGEKPVPMDENAENQEEDRDWLETARFDLQEPFTRIEEALRLIPGSSKS